MTDKSALLWQSPVGVLAVAENGAGITDLFLCRDGNLPQGFRREATPLLREALRQLGEYFTGNRREFRLPLSLFGTAFQLADWAALRTIPYGETRSYGQIAAQTGRPRACRAVGGANARNPVMIVVPCHRVIASDGSLGGFSAGTEVKRYLLKLERTHSGGSGVVRGSGRSV